MTYSGVLATVLSGLEPAVAIALACIPLMRPLLGRKSAKTNDSHYKYDSSKMSRVYSKRSGLDTSNTFTELVDENDDSSQIQLQSLKPSLALHLYIPQDNQRPAQKSQDIVIKKSWDISRS